MTFFPEIPKNFSKFDCCQENATKLLTSQLMMQ